ncbi:MAG: SUMF1/EgtB/PvdO family nonheme iron enzyme [Planctomycetaceae bacterium]|jgi:formylglycine-generating enzyme required for sulfatase activity|nr:SUMF1/EgtB/PvdO family nonheme iron enzyme [Planctomycetaceae bacterium]
MIKKSNLNQFTNIFKSIMTSMSMIISALLPIFIFTTSFNLSAATKGYDNGTVPVNTPESAKRMIEDLIKNFGDRYVNGAAYLSKIESLSEQLKREPNNENLKKEFDTTLRAAALANPLLDFDKILVVRRNTAKGFGFIGLNPHTNEEIRRHGWDNEIAILSDLRTEPQLTPIYKHPNGAPIRDTDLHFDGKRIMFSSVNENKRFAIFEIDINGQNLRELTPKGLNDVDWFDSCYLPEEGAFITASTAGMQGLPCENGGKPMVNLYRVTTGKKNEDGTFDPPKVRQLTFEQDSDYHPTVTHDGKVMYLRWEYSDIPHYMSRILFSMHPDGRNQRAIWGSGSYFPTAYKNPRVIPGHPSMVVGVVSGHHTTGGGIPETGRLVLIDPQLATKYPFRFDPETKEWGKPLQQISVSPRIYPKEVTGCVQEIPGYGRDVVGNVYDNQGGSGKYRFVYPYPLNENYFLVSMRADGRGAFDLYLVDRWDNMTKITDIKDNSIFHAIPLIPREHPPIRPDAADSSKKEGTIFISDVYFGGGLKGVPRGKAKSLRIFAYHFGYRSSGGHESVGQNSSWDIKRIIGTVPIEADGSAMFNVPANTPISIQVLDENGAAIQLMRSWTVCMPGEQQACIGCHETPLEVSPSKINPLASRTKPHEITPWRGNTRPFGYEAEIQPILNKECVPCHNDETAVSHNIPSFVAKNTGNWRSDTSYAALNPYVWRPGPEPDLDMLNPLEFHVTVSELVQRLSRGHYGVKFEGELRDRIYTWIDLNVPYRGMWDNKKYEPRRLELQILYAGIDDNPEKEYRESLAEKEKNKNETSHLLKPDELTAVIQKYRKNDNIKPNKTVIKDNQIKDEKFELDFENGTKIKFVKIPAGEFVSGDITSSLPDERKQKSVKIEKSFWIAETELTNRQYAAFDPEHDTRYLNEDGKDHVVPGYIANHPDQPAARISFDEAKKFCEWLSAKSGKNVTLPTESQWEWAARAGTESPFWYGGRDTDFSKYANLAGDEVRETRTQWENGATIHQRRWYDEKQAYPLRDSRWKDKWFVVDYVKQYEPNQWGLYDIIGNVWEWTIPEPDNTPSAKVTARGGSWKDRPNFAGASARVIYEPWQKVMNVGFRPIINE